MVTTSISRPVLPIEARGGSIQRIHTKLFSPQDLLRILRGQYGDGGFYVEMRHNVYSVSRFHGDPLDLRSLLEA